MIFWQPVLKIEYLNYVETLNVECARQIIQKAPRYRENIPKFLLSAAKKRSAELAEQYIGHEVIVYSSDQQVWITSKIYSDDDPVWDAVPSVDDCRALFSEIIGRAVSDTQRGIKSYGCAYATTLDQSQAFSYIGSSRLDFDCSVVGLDPDLVRQKVQAPSSFEKRANFVRVSV